MKSIILIWLVALTCIFYSCGAQRIGKKITLDGGWISVGYARYLDIQHNVVSIYDTHGSNCTFNVGFPLKDFRNYAKKITPDTIVLNNGFTEYYFTRATNMDFRCTGSNVLNTKNPLENFDVLWQTFSENYCSFELRNIHWDDQKIKYRTRLSEHSTNAELFTVLKEMLGDFNDGHVTIDTLEEEATPAPDRIESAKRAVIEALNKKYLTEAYSYNQGVINYGFLNPDVSYVQINDCENFANYKIDKNLPWNEFMRHFQTELEERSNPEKDMIRGVQMEMSSIVKKIKPSKYCIIDLLFNGGGADAASLEILSFFAKQKIKAFSKKARFKDGYTNQQEAFSAPKENHYSGNLIILTSHQTASAAEVLVMSSMNLDAKRIGSNTQGIFSDMLEKKLPNGWAFTLSNEIYNSAGGQNYEMTGIPPHIGIEYNANAEIFYQDLLMAINAGGDEAIEMALKSIVGEKK
jgi:carboxyl-terminal processing protease